MNHQELLKTPEGRADLIWACAFVDSPRANDCRKWTAPEYEACQAMHDVHKLAQLGEHELRRLGCKLAGEGYVADPVREHNLYEYEPERVGRRVRLFFGRDGTVCMSSDPKRFRYMLAKWLALPDGASEKATQVWACK